MAKYQVECSVCGKSFERVLFGPGKDREWKLAQTQTCPECWEAEQAAARAKANAAAVEFGKSLPALDGSEKQIAWAEVLRKKAIERCEEFMKNTPISPDLPEVGILLPIIFEHFKKIPNAKYWIEKRDESPINCMMGDFKDWVFAK